MTLSNGQQITNNKLINHNQSRSMSGSGSSTTSSSSGTVSSSATSNHNLMSHSLSTNHNHNTAISYRSVFGTPIHKSNTSGAATNASQKYSYQQQPQHKMLAQNVTLSKSNGKLYHSLSTESLVNVNGCDLNTDINRKSAFKPLKPTNSSQQHPPQRITYQFEAPSTNRSNHFKPLTSKQMNCVSGYSTLNKAKVSLKMPYENIHDLKQEISMNKLSAVKIDCGDGNLNSNNNNNTHLNHHKEHIIHDEFNFDQKLHNTNLSMRSHTTTVLSSPSMTSSVSNTLMNSLQFFSHFDVQSILFDYNEVKLNKDSLHTSINTRTGASAASRQGSMENLNKIVPIVQQADTTGQSASSSQSGSSSSISFNNSPRQSLTNQKSQNGLISNDLVQICPYFRLEMGGDVFKGLGLVDESQRRVMKLNSVSLLDRVEGYFKKELIDTLQNNWNETFSIEYQDFGAYFYRFYFFNQEHVNYFGHDRDIGPVAISIKRDKNICVLNETSQVSAHRSDYVYRFIMRTSDLYTLRGTISEDHIPTKQSSINNTKGISHKEIISFLVPQLDLNSLRVGEMNANEKLLQLDEQYIVKNYKIGVLLCKAGQSTEEEMYNNMDSTPAFDEFLYLLGETVVLKNFLNYRGGLDTKNDDSGITSVYTKFRDREIMFHVSTMLPFTIHDRQQLTRKRHIGNNLVTVIFQEEGSAPFSPKNVRSHYQHIFIIVRVLNPNTPHTQYSVAISCSKDIPTFGPPLPKNPLFKKSHEFREFLLTKLINADNAGLRCDKFAQMRMRARNGILKDLVLNYSTKTTLESSSRFGLFNFGSIKQKKLRSKSLQIFSSSDTLQLNGGIFWQADVEDSKHAFSCHFGISEINVIAVDQMRKSVIFSVPCSAVIGWSIDDLNTNLIVYFDHGEYINLHLKYVQDLKQILKRLEYFTKGTKTIELSLEKKDYGQLGFSIHHDGVVSEVEPYSLAHYRGLKPGTRIVKIMDSYVMLLNHEKMIDLLRKSLFLKVTFLPPFDDGSPRRGLDTHAYSLYSYLSTCSSERSIDLNNSSSSCKQLIKSSYANGVYFGYDTLPINGTKTQLQSQSATAMLQSSNQRAFKNSTTSINKLIEEPTQAPTNKITSNLEWTKLVQTATKAFENAHRSSDSIYYSDLLYNNGKMTTTNEITSDSSNTMNSQLVISELKEALNRVSNELEQEKVERQQLKTKMSQVLEDNKSLRMEVLKVKDENKSLNKRLYEVFNIKNSIYQSHGHNTNPNILAAIHMNK